jgi:hypothetical protein
MTATVKPFILLAAYAADSPRIKQLVETGRTDPAIDLLVVRMNDVMRGFVEGDAFEDPELFKALDYINRFPGPAGKFLMGTMAARQIEIMVLELMLKDEG